MNASTNTVRRGFCALGAAAVLGLGFAGQADARPEPGEPVPTTLVNPPPPPPEPDGGGIELVQLGGGILAGLALAGAGAAVASRRHHAHATPA